ncbi:HK97-gp10 family putative phage morphogenesis protein [Streptomyces sp. NPDC102274]|uniref:HK97-gp10 family putative phage morphogenesis protein n=1 Tax=Streptomyces sp. NPDC102274 TaxID=3366151 RepID=UPI0037F83467
MARGRSRLDGLTEALRAVGRVPEAMRAARTETLNEWAGTVQDGAEERAPRRTGDLWAALDQKVEERWGRAEVGVWDQAQLEYALYVERGTSSMAEQPYLLPAFEAARPQVTRTYRVAFRRHMGGG